VLRPRPGLDDGEVEDVKIAVDEPCSAAIVGATIDESAWDHGQPGGFHLVKGHREA
jgi:hypothetical protein